MCGCRCGKELNGGHTALTLESACCVPVACWLSMCMTVHGQVVERKNTEIQLLKWKAATRKSVCRGLNHACLHIGALARVGARYPVVAGCVLAARCPMYAGP